MSGPHEISDLTVIRYLEETAVRYATMAVIRFRIAVDEVRLVAGDRNDLLQIAAAHLMLTNGKGSKTDYSRPLAAAICLTAMEASRTEMACDSVVLDRCNLQ